MAVTSKIAASDGHVDPCTAILSELARPLKLPKNAGPRLIAEMFLEAVALVPKFRSYGYNTTHAKKTLFLDAIAQGADIKEAARAAGIHRQTHRDWLHASWFPDWVRAEYAKAFEAARERFRDSVKQERRGTKQTVLFSFPEDRGKPISKRKRPAVGTPAVFISKRK